MCGVIACRMDRLPVTDYLLTALRRLEYRGYDSVGIGASTDSGELIRLRTAAGIDALEGMVQGWTGPDIGSAGIGHTRWATHGAVSEENAHPHADCAGRILLVHNGIIANAGELRKQLQSAGHRFASAGDSEVLSHLIEDEWRSDRDLTAAVRAALSRAVGTWGLAVLVRDSGRIVLASNKSPIMIARSALGEFAASDIAAVADWVQEFRALEDGEVVELAPTELNRRRLCNAAAPRLRPCTVRASDIELGAHSDYMAKEIDEQPAVAARLVDEVAGGIANGQLWNNLGMRSFGHLHVIGCGTSLNAGHVIANLVRDIGGIPVTSSAGSEAGREILPPDTLCLAMSQSGETADVLNALDCRSLHGVPTLALTNQAHSTLARRVDGVVSCAAGLEVGVAATKTFVCQIIAGTAAMASALIALERIPQSFGRLLADGLRRLPEELAEACATAKCLIPPIAEELTSATGFVFVARGSGLPYAAEGALKLKELSYVWAEHCAAGELKHGPLALVDQDMPLLAVGGDRLLAQKLASNLEEARARGGHLTVLIDRDTEIQTTAHMDVVRLPTPHHAWSAFLHVVPLQLLAYHAALLRGTDIDQPRNLAKSVTVE